MKKGTGAGLLFNLLGWKDSVIFAPISVIYLCEVTEQWNSE